jgi:hypothetical protein
MSGNKGTGGPAPASEKSAGRFTPPGYNTRLAALMDVIRFGPELLSGPEFLALLFHVERSLCYGKKADAASGAQMVRGIYRKDKTWIRGGSGLKKVAACQANTSLEGKGLLRRTARSSEERGHEPTEYEVLWEPLRRYLTEKLADKTRTLVRHVNKPPRSPHEQAPCSPSEQEQSRKHTQSGKPEQSEASAAAASAFGSLPLSEATCQADYRFTSAKTAEGSRDGRAGAAETAKTERQGADPKADAPAKAAAGEENPPMRAKTQKPAVADDEDTPDPDAELENVLSCFEPNEREKWDGTGVPDWVPGAALAAASGASAEAVCSFLRQKADAGWQPRKWATIPAMVRDAFAPKPKAAHVEPWTGLDVTNVQKWLGAFMDGEEPPHKLVSWIIDFASEYSLRASDIHEALDAAWKRVAAPGQKNAPRSWNWFYEVLRATFISGYAARLPEVPAAPHPAHHASAEEMARGMEALDSSLVKSYRCKCGAEIRQYTDRVEGVCTCGQAKPISRAGTAQTPPLGNRRAAGGRQ